MKDIYEVAEMEVIKFDSEDIIQDSDTTEPLPV